MYLEEKIQLLIVSQTRRQIGTAFSDQPQQNVMKRNLLLTRPLVVVICIGIYYQEEDLIGTIADYSSIIDTFQNIYK